MPPPPSVTYNPTTNHIIFLALAATRARLPSAREDLLRPRPPWALGRSVGTSERRKQQRRRRRTIEGARTSSLLRVQTLISALIINLPLKCLFLGRRATRQTHKYLLSYLLMQSDHLYKYTLGLPFPQSDHVMVGRPLAYLGKRTEGREEGFVRRGESRGAIQVSCVEKGGVEREGDTTRAGRGEPVSHYGRGRLSNFLRWHGGARAANHSTHFSF